MHLARLRAHGLAPWALAVGPDPGPSPPAGATRRGQTQLGLTPLGLTPVSEMDST